MHRYGSVAVSIHVQLYIHINVCRSRFGIKLSCLLVYTLYMQLHIMYVGSGE